jgi:hypothetical protein
MADMMTVDNIFKSGVIYKGEWEYLDFFSS